MQINEAAVLMKLVVSKLHARGWDDVSLTLHPLVTASTVPTENSSHQTYRPDILLKLTLDANSPALPIAVIEVKRIGNTHTGIEQSKEYAQILNVPFAFATDGQSFVLYDRSIDSTTQAQTIDEFPTPDDLRKQYEVIKGIDLSAESSRALRTPYIGGDAAPRSYQDAAIRAIIEALLQGKKRILVELAVGLGKSFIIANLVKRLKDGGAISTVLYVTDRVSMGEQFRQRTSELLQVTNVESAEHIVRGSQDLLIVTVQKLRKITKTSPAILENIDAIILDSFENYSDSWFKSHLSQTRVAQIAFVSAPIAKMIRSTFPDVVYRYTVQQAIQDAYLTVQQPNPIESGYREATPQIIPTTNPPDLITGQPISDEQIFHNYLVFLSYRRDDSKAQVEKLFERLSRVFQFKNDSRVFMDTTSINYGEDFSETILRAIDECGVVLAIIGRTWLTITDRTGKRRLDDPNDFVRREIEYALQGNKRVIPVLVNKADMPTPGDLPDTLLRRLAHLQAFEITHKDKYFDAEVDDLIDVLKNILRTQARLDS